MAVYKKKIQELDAAWVRELQDKYGDADIEIRIYEKGHRADSFSEDDFWHIISLLDWSAKEDDAILAPAVGALSEKDESAIYAFQDFLAEKLHQLDHRQYAEHLGEDAPKADGSFSSDYFLYARACVVANGKEYFQSVLDDPAKMPAEYTFEPLLSLARKAYRLKTGQEFTYQPTISYETFANTEGWPDPLTNKLFD